MITIYTITYNEQFMLPHFIAHYRTCFPNCHIIVYDNQSTDRTVEIAKTHNCEVCSYDTAGKLSDTAFLNIKNNCWKDAKTDWVLIADCDELCEISEGDLAECDIRGQIPRFEGYNMVNLNDDMNFSGIKHGVRAPFYDKMYCFNKKVIKEINYGPGCHTASPEGEVLSTEATIIRPCYHFKFINPDYMVERYALFATRLSEENIRFGYSWHYTRNEQQIRSVFEEARSKAQLLL